MEPYFHVRLIIFYKKVIVTLFLTIMTIFYIENLFFLRDLFLTIATFYLITATISHSFNCNFITHNSELTAHIETIFFRKAKKI